MGEAGRTNNLKGGGHDMAKSGADRARAYRARKGAKTRDGLAECGTPGAAMRHRREIGKRVEGGGPAVTLREVCAVCADGEARRAKVNRGARLHPVTEVVEIS